MAKIDLFLDDRSLLLNLVMIPMKLRCKFFGIVVLSHILYAGCLQKDDIMRSQFGFLVILLYL